MRPLVQRWCCCPLLAAALFSLATSGVLCQSESPDKVFFRFQDLIKKEFQAQAEVVLVLSGTETTTIFVDMYHDLEGWRGRLDMYNNDNTASYFYFPDMQELVTVSGTTCGVSARNEGGFFSSEMEWGWTSDLRVIGPGSLLFRANTTMTAEKEEEVRGIKCEKFTIKDPVEPDVQLTYWYTLESWKSPTEERMRVPVRVTAVGKTKTGDLNTTVDFTSFNADIKNENAFKIPRGIGCLGFKQHESKVFPTILPQYSFAMEVYDGFTRKESGKSEVVFYQVWYDGLGRAAKVIGYNNGKPFTEIQDFNRGVLYRFNENDVCTVGPIVNSNVEVVGKSTITNVMKDSKQVLRLDQDFYYLGQDVERDVSCEVWEAVEMNGTVSGVTVDKIVYTYYISTNSTEFVTDGKKDARVPISLRLTIYPLIGYSEPFVIQMNFFRFDQPLGTTFFDEMNIRNCFPGENGRRLYAITFEDTEEVVSSLKALHKTTKYAARQQIQMSTGVSSIRLPSVNVFYEPRRIVVQGEMLDVPPAIASFLDLRGDEKLFPTSGEKQVGRLRNPDECAKLCLENNLTDCTAFTTCLISDSNYVDCYLTSQKEKDKWSKPIQDRTCRLYIKAVSDTLANEPPLEAAMDTLKTFAEKGEILISVTSEKEQVLTIKSSGFDNSFQPSVSGSQMFEVVQADKQLSSSVTTMELMMNLMSPEECYRRCQEEPGMDCASFSYCQKTHKCILSSVYVTDQNTEDVEPASSCYVYRKTALQFFEPFPGKTQGQKGEAMTVNTAEECAYYCRNNAQKFECRGFDFCPGTRRCTLSKTHTLDTSQLVDGSPQCSFYHMLYGMEFANMGEELVKDKDAVDLKSVSFEECAAQCVREEGFTCQSVNFCLDGSCQLNTKSSLDDVDVEERENCKNYLRISVGSTLDPDEKIFFPLKDVITSNFQAHVEVFTDGDKKAKFFTMEHHDIKNKRSKVSFPTSFQDVSDYYYYADPYQFVSIDDDQKCLVNTNRDENQFLDTAYWGWADEENGIMGASVILFRKTTKPADAKTKTSLRGIVCDVYEATDKLEEGITITYYMTGNNWRSPTNTQMRIPIRVTAIGALKTGEVVNTIWDFTYFEADVPESGVYQIPAGVGCENFQLKNSPVLPDITAKYSYVSELFDTTLGLKGKVTMLKVWYDEFKGISMSVGIKSDLPYTEIQDFNTGINYHLNENDACEIGPIVRSESEKALTALLNTMKNPKEFLNLDADYYYIGKATMRGIECDVWEGIKTNQMIEGFTVLKAVYTYYLSQSKVEVVSDGDFNLQVPVALKMTYIVDTEKDEERYEINFFDFDEDVDHDFYSDISIENCFPDETQRNMFVLSIPANESAQAAAKANTKMFEEVTGWSIQAATSISPLRLPLVKTFFEPDQILVQGVLLERPPVIMGFYLADQSQYPPNVGKVPVESVSSKDECALSCVSKADIKCMGFTVCPADQATGKSECYRTSMESSPTDWPQKTTKEGCQFYIKSVMNETMEDVSLNAAVALLEEVVRMKQLQIPYFSSEGMLMSYVPNFVQTGLRIGKGTDSEKYSLVVEGQQLLPGSGSKTSLDVEGKVSSPRECYSRCLKETNVACASFSFCASTQQCILSSLYPRKGNTEGMKEGTSCNVYRKESLMYFEEMKGQMSQAQGDKVQSAASPAECAQACRDETSFQCRGFDFCRKDKTCSLSKTHQLSLGTLIPSPDSCTHFSRKFSSDFEMVGRQLLVDDQSQTYEAASVEECSKLCYEYQNFECKSFDFCPIEGRLTSTCSISKNVIEKSSKVIDSPNCGYYERMKEERVEPKKEEVKETGPPSTTKVSNKTFSATLACLFFLGIVLGVGAFLGYSYYRKKSAGTDGVSIRYTRGDN